MMFAVTLDFWIRLALGHCLGDYGLQTTKMALGKSKSWRKCTWHCIAYTFAIAIWLVPEAFQAIYYYIAFLCIVFATHLAIDKTPIIQWWLKKIGARTFENAAAQSSDTSIPGVSREFYISFTAIVHAVFDNAIH